MARQRTKYGTTVRRHKTGTELTTHTRTSRVKLLTTKRGRKTARSGLGRIRIGKNWWSIVVTLYPLTGVWGYCDPNLRLIVVDGTGDAKNFLDTLLHETSHGLDFARPEGDILKQGNVLADLMTAFGYKN